VYCKAEFQRHRKVMKEAVEIGFHPTNMDREDSLSLSKSWKPFIHT